MRLVGAQKILCSSGSWAKLCVSDNALSDIVVSKNLCDNVVSNKDRDKIERDNVCVCVCSIAGV